MSIEGATWRSPTQKNEECKRDDSPIKPYSPYGQGSLKKDNKHIPSLQPNII